MAGPSFEAGWKSLFVSQGWRKKCMAFQLPPAAAQMVPKHTSTPGTWMKNVKLASRSALTPWALSLLRCQCTMFILFTRNFSGTSNFGVKASVRFFPLLASLLVLSYVLECNEIRWHIYHLLLQARGGITTTTTTTFPPFSRNLRHGPTPLWTVAPIARPRSTTRPTPRRPG